MVVAAETETEIVVAQDLVTEIMVAQDLETPTEEDPTVGIESTTVDESQIVVDTGAPLTEGARGLAAEAVTGLMLRLATVQMQQHCAPILDHCPRQPSPLLATAQLPEYVLGPVPGVDVMHMAKRPQGLLNVGTLSARMAVLRSCALGS